jgi:hypothetical protein
MAEKTHLHKEYRAFYPRLSATAHPSFYGMSELFTQSQSAVIKPACHFAWIILTEVNAAFKLGLDDTLRDLRCLVLALPPGV